ncbi:carboxypeptidase X1 [Sarotherodon galilaeus]
MANVNLIQSLLPPSLEPQSAPRRSSPPGGKSSGIFGEPEPAAQPQRPIPPGGPTSNIFGPAVTAPAQSPSQSHPNKPKVGFPQAPEVKTSQPVVKEETAPPVDAPAKEEPTAATAAALSAPSGPEPTPSSFPDDTSLKNHEPHLGPKPRSHNRVLNPPGGKSSVVFY